jgi:hypothetical protein
MMIKYLGKNALLHRNFSTYFLPASDECRSDLSIPMWFRMDRYMSMGDKSNLMFTTGMTWFCLIAKSSEHVKDFVSGDAFESSFLRVAESAEVLRHISFFHFEVNHEGFPATPRTAPEFLFFAIRSRVTRSSQNRPGSAPTNSRTLSDIPQN